MNTSPQATWIAFAKSKRIASGCPRDVAAKVKDFVDSGTQPPVLVFDGTTSQLVELDLRGSLSTVLRRLRRDTEPETEAIAGAQANAPRLPGRPRLGVTAREVTLLPRHWDWLASQPGGASVALRKLVEQALRASKNADRVRQAREAAYRFMSAMAGDEPGFEEASRALFAGDPDRLRETMARWPADVRKHALALADMAAAEQKDVEQVP